MLDCLVHNKDPITYLYRCSQYYLLMAGNCVDQNIVIGVFAGVGGALFIALVIAVIYLKCEKDSDGKTMDTERR